MCAYRCWTGCFLTSPSKSGRMTSSIRPKRTTSAASVSQQRIPRRATPSVQWGSCCVRAFGLLVCFADTFLNCGSGIENGAGRR